jgi:glycosyltransferase involved in cell wall biosynthesis
MIAAKKSGLKLIVQIPAYNEQDSIGEVIKSIPRKIPGISEVRVLVIDDGSQDKTIEEAKKAGADYIISNVGNKGLAYTFQRGINEALKLGADIIVNTDADNQYNQKEIPKIVQPILEEKADLVSGNRNFTNLKHMPGIKKFGNSAGTRIVSLGSGIKLDDVSSGFRAFSRETALRLFVTATHTYTHETLIQAARNKLKILEVPIEFKKRQYGESRLITSKWGHTKKTLSTMIRSSLNYQPLKIFSNFGLILILIGLLLYFRWIFLMYIIVDHGDHIQSLLIGAILIIFGGLSVFLGFIADMLSANRRYLEEILYRVRKAELK